MNGQRIIIPFVQFKQLVNQNMEANNYELTINIALVNDEILYQQIILRIEKNLLAYSEVFQSQFNACWL